jgi:gamma-glutamyl-gamma-aminobutyrate hydrolase PuuD
MKKKLRLIVDTGFSNSYAEFLSLKYDIEIIEFKKDKDGYYPKNIDLVVFTGGEDVSPDYYNEEKGIHTHNNTKRDEYEYDIFEKYKYVPKLGICRG